MMTINYEIRKGGRTYDTILSGPIRLKIGSVRVASQPRSVTFLLIGTFKLKQVGSDRVSVQCRKSVGHGLEQSLSV